MPPSAKVNAMTSTVSGRRKACLSTFMGSKFSILRLGEGDAILRLV
jgi:hypothetical protein